jgi:quercetin dioxygenase-like cupin family protein
MTTCMATWRRANANLVAIAWSVMALAAAQTASAQLHGCDTPVSERTSEVGCYTSAIKVLGAMPEGPVFWHLYNYPTRAAAEAVKGPRGTVVEAFGRVWLYAVEEEGWRPSGGERVTAIGPLPVASGKQYTARYFEVVFTPGMEGHPHRHSGPEAWYVLTGAQCLETPEGIMVKHAGESGIVPEGPPMNMKAIDTEIRRAVFIVLHDTSQPWITTVSDWKPKGLCPK